MPNETTRQNFKARQYLITELQGKKIQNYITLYASAAEKLTINHLSMWLDSSVDRALHRYRKDIGSNPVQG